MKIKDISGQRFGLLVAIRPISKHSGGRKRVFWECRCDCGNVVFVNTDSIRRGLSKSCGCEQKRLASINHTIHGHTKRRKLSRTFQSWRKMVERCRGPNRYYSEKGVSVCERWLEFKNFLEDMGERPEERTIDRIDPYGNYEPGNCRWADWETQSKNRRRAKDNGTSKSI